MYINISVEFAFDSCVEISNFLKWKHNRNRRQRTFRQNCKKCKRRKYNEQPANQPSTSTSDSHNENNSEQNENNNVRAGQVLPDNALSVSNDVTTGSKAVATGGEVPTETSACGFKMKKPKLPKFSGDVQEYAIFKSDFKHAVETRYSKRDAVTFLRARKIT